MAFIPDPSPTVLFKSFRIRILLYNQVFQNRIKEGKKHKKTTDRIRIHNIACSFLCQAIEFF